RRADEEIESFDIAPGPKPEIAENEGDEILAADGEEATAPPESLAEEGIVAGQAESRPDDEIYDNQAAQDDDDDEDEAADRQTEPGDYAERAQDAIEGAP